MNHHHNHHHNHQFPAPPSPFGGGQSGMKRSPSEQALAALVNETCNNDNNNNNNSSSNSNSNNILPIAATSICGGVGLVDGCLQQQLEVAFDNPTANAAIEDNLSFNFKHDHHYHHHHQDIMNEFGGLPWNQNFPSPQSCISATIDSPISMSAGSPTSILTPKAGDNQASGSSEDEDGETKAGLENQSNNPDAIKRLRRMESNRDSARRSRRRKQKQLQELENQVDKLAEENVQLFKQLGDAAQQLREATTNNRVLKSDVEALRAKVNLAADRVKRGTMSPALNHILQAQLAATTQLLNSQPVARAGLVGFQGPDNTTAFGGLFPGITGPNNINVDVHVDVGDHILNGNNNNNNADNPNEAEIWTWDSSDQVCGLPK